MRSGLDACRDEYLRKMEWPTFSQPNERQRLGKQDDVPPPISA
jgi:hypothetical protein